MARMIFYILILAIPFSMGSCEKAIEEKKRDILITAMTEGQWKVGSYLEINNQIAGQFVDYRFQFREDGSVLGISGSSTLKGTWAGDIANRSITSNFPTESDPLKKLNGVWKIISTKMDYVEAEMSTNEGKMILHLEK